jgi:hypothetical protein
LFHEAKRFAHDLASGVIRPGGDFLADHLLKVRSKADVHGHKGNLRNFIIPRIALLSKLVNL